jgi:hypothetical protein
MSAHPKRAAPDSNADASRLGAGNGKAQIAADEDAIAWIRRGIEANRNLPVAHFFLAAALAALNRLDDARNATSAASDEPTCLVQRERIYEGMSRAGVPKG